MRVKKLVLMIYDDAMKTFGSFSDWKYFCSFVQRSYYCSYTRSDQRSDMYLSMRALYKESDSDKFRYPRNSLGRGKLPILAVSCSASMQRFLGIQHRHWYRGAYQRGTCEWLPLFKTNVPVLFWLFVFHYSLFFVSFSIYFFGIQNICIIT